MRSFCLFAFFFRMEQKKKLKTLKSVFPDNCSDRLRNRKTWLLYGAKREGRRGCKRGFVPSQIGSCVCCSSLLLQIYEHFGNLLEAEGGTGEAMGVSKKRRNCVKDSSTVSQVSPKQRPCPQSARQATEDHFKASNTGTGCIGSITNRRCLTSYSSQNANVKEALRRFAMASRRF